LRADRLHRAYSEEYSDDGYWFHSGSREFGRGRGAVYDGLVGAGDWDLGVASSLSGDVCCHVGLLGWVAAIEEEK